MYKRHVEKFFLAMIVGCVGMGVNYMSRMSENMQQMTIAVQLLTEKLTNIDRITQDHEHRLRKVERHDRIK